ncbi:MAG: hypothetical protein KKA61_00860, partial [Nanoarchaeota archaeon]|nr:hypothetical protein [Nanoarchaeota archaeon]
KRIAHISYGFENFRRGIDVFQVNRDDIGFISNKVDFKRTISFDKKELRTLERRNINKRQGIFYEIISDIKDTDIEKEVLYLAQKDIGDFCKKEAINQETKKVYLDKIMPKTRLRFVKPRFLLQGGKQEFVPLCRLEANLDFSKGCISGFIPVEINDAYKKGFMYGFIDPLSECSYCYSKYQHKDFPKHILKFDKEKLKNELEGNCYLDRKNKLGKKVEVLRLGKRTEAGSKYTLDQLVVTLETCLETKTKVVMPTKFLDFNDDIAKLLKNTKSSLLYSIGWDKFEKGACLNGCNNEFRLEQAVKYKEKGVNSILYLLIDAVNLPHEREKEILSFAKENKLPVLLLPIRLNNKSIAFDITSIPWSKLKMRNQLTIPGISRKEEAESYELINSHTLVARKINEEWARLVGDNNGNIRMCHHNEDKTWCGSCFLEGEQGIIEKSNYHKNPQKTPTSI